MHAAMQLLRSASLLPHRAQPEPLSKQGFAVRARSSLPCLRHPWPVCQLSLLQGPNGEVEFSFEPACHLGAKLAGVHWWFKSRAHAAELTAGYYNTRERDGYADVMRVLKGRNTRVSFTCVEMRDCEHPPEGRCSPEGEAADMGVACKHAVCVPAY